MIRSLHHAFDALATGIGIDQHVQVNNDDRAILPDLQAAMEAQRELVAAMAAAAPEQPAPSPSMWSAVGVLAQLPTDDRLYRVSMEEDEATVILAGAIACPMKRIEGRWRLLFSAVFETEAKGAREFTITWLRGIGDVTRQATDGVKAGKIVNSADAAAIIDQAVYGTIKPLLPEASQKLDLPKGAGERTRLGNRFGHVVACVLAADGKTLFIGNKRSQNPSQMTQSLDRADVEGGTAPPTVPMHFGVFWMRASADGQFILVAGERARSARVLRNTLLTRSLTKGFDAETESYLQLCDGKTLRPLWERRGLEMLHIAISRAGDRIAVSHGTNTSLLDPATGKTIGTIKDEWNYAMAFTADSKSIYFAGNVALFRHDFADSRTTPVGPIDITPRMQGVTDAMTVSADGRYVAVGMTLSVDVVDTQTQQVHSLPIVAGRGSLNRTNFLAFTVDGSKLIAATGLQRNLGDVALGALVAPKGGAGPDLIMWNVGTWKESGRLSGHQHAVTQFVLLNGDKQIVTGSMDGTLRLWDVPQ